MINNKFKEVFPVLMTVLATLFIGWSVWQAFSLNNKPGELKAADTKLRETKAISVLKEIEAAQNKYIQMDPDGDGKKEFCRFLPHLWQSVRRKDSEPVRLNLVNKKLAFATGKDFALDGYIFKILRSREKNGEEEGILIDYSKEWAVMAMPITEKFVDTKKYGKTGKFSYILNSTGKIFRADASSEEVKLLPERVPNKQWTEISK